MMKEYMYNGFMENTEDNIYKIDELMRCTEDRFHEGDELMGYMEDKINESDETQDLMADKSRRKLNPMTSWEKKDRYRRKLRRDFLSLNPAMRFEDISPLPTLGGIIIYKDDGTDAGLYCINHANHIYYSKRHCLKKLGGTLEWGKKGQVFGVGRKERLIVKQTNRRIRHSVITEDSDILRFSECKKMYGPCWAGIL